MGQFQLAGPRCGGINALQHEPIDSGPQYAPLEDTSGKHRQLSFDYSHSPCLKLARSHILPAVVHREICSPGAVLVIEWAVPAVGISSRFVLSLKSRVSAWWLGTNNMG
jgi:hypothetical protein